MSSAKMQIGIVGAGGFGQALGKSIARQGHSVTMWTRTHAKLKKSDDAATLTSTKNLEDLAPCSLLFFAVPSDFVASLAFDLGSYIDGRHLIVHVSRGLAGMELQTLSNVIRERTPARRVGVLAGPLSADVLEKGAPSGGIVGSFFPEVANAVRRALGETKLRLYQTDDVVGVEVAAAMVGLMSLIIGYARGLGFPAGTIALVTTRAMAESTRLGVTLGGQEKTFAGLAGLGDLVAAALGDDRPELRLGNALAAGLSIEEAVKAAGAHIEGISIAQRVADYAARVGIEAPISATIAAVLNGSLTPNEAAKRLMSRQVVSE